MVSPHSDGREFSSGSGPQPHGQVATKAVLAHRSGELSLDNAFDLIEGHPLHTLTYQPSQTYHFQNI